MTKRLIENQDSIDDEFQIKKFKKDTELKKIIVVSENEEEKNITNETNNLIIEKNNILKLKYEYFNKIKNCNNNIRELDKKIYQTCDHEFVRDYDNLYDRPSKICNKCNLRANPYIYR